MHRGEMWSCFMKAEIKAEAQHLDCMSWAE